MSSSIYQALLVIAPFRNSDVLSRGLIAYLPGYLDPAFTPRPFLGVESRLRLEPLN